MKSVGISVVFARPLSLAVPMSPSISTKLSRPVFRRKDERSV